MANNVFANGREISCKKADGKTICAFPDWCMTPPTSPATPTGVPVPYPNTGMAKDTTNGSRTVKISGNEIIKKDVSYYKTSYGDEAGCATPAKKGVVTGTIKGKVYFTSWSMDVKVEGENAVRHLDTTTHNHGSNANETIPWPDLDTMKIANMSGCADEIVKIKKACNPPEEKAKCPDSNLSQKSKAWRSSSKGSAVRKISYEELKKEYISYSKTMSQNECHRKLKCVLVPKKNNGKPPAGCCPGQTPDHIVDGSSFKGVSGYNYDKAPCVCVSGHTSSVGTHGIISNARRLLIKKWNKVKSNKKNNWNFGNSKEVAAKSVSLTFPASDCDEKCIKEQLQKHHESMVDGINDKTKIKQKASGKKKQGLAWGEWMKVQKALK